MRIETADHDLVLESKILDMRAATAVLRPLHIIMVPDAPRITAPPDWIDPNLIEHTLLGCGSKLSFAPLDTQGDPRALVFCADHEDVNE